MGIETNENFHEALYDVEVLEKLTSLINKDDLFKNCNSYVDSLRHLKDLDKTAAMLPSLAPLKNVISDGMLKKIATQGISYEIVQSEFDKGGKVKLVQFLSEPMIDKKPKVTKDKRVINKLCEYSSQKKNY